MTSAKVLRAIPGAVDVVPIKPSEGLRRSCHQSREGGALRRQHLATCRIHRGRLGRQADHDNCRRPRALSSAAAICPRYRATRNHQAYPCERRRRSPAWGGGMNKAPAKMGMATPVSVSARLRFQRSISRCGGVNVVEGPVMIKSENGELVSYVQLNVRDRD